MVIFYFMYSFIDHLHFYYVLHRVIFRLNGYRICLISHVYIIIVCLSTDKSEVVCIDVIFDLGDFEDIERTGLLSLFQECVEENLHLKTGVSRRRITEVKLYEGSIIFEFDLHPAMYSDDGTCRINVLRN